MASNYVSNLGFTAGPLQIEHSGTWLTHSTEKEALKVIVDGVTYEATQLDSNTVTHTVNIKESIYRRYLAISRLRNVDSGNVQLAPLMAGHPLCGTYPSGDGNKPFCDINAVATVGWVMSYATLAPGDRALALDDLIYRTEFNELVAQVTANTSSIGELQNRATSLETRVSNLENITTDIDKMYWTKNVEEQGVIFIGWEYGLDPSKTWN